MSEQLGGVAAEAPAPGVGVGEPVEGWLVGWFEVDAVFQDGLDGSVLGVVEGESASARRFEAHGAEAPGEPDDALSGAQVVQDAVSEQPLDERVAGRPDVFALAQNPNTLHEEGYRGLRARNLKGRHVEALVREWIRRGLSHATMKNRLAHVRWWAHKVGKPNVVKSNADYGLRPRSQVSDGTRRRDLDAEKLARVKDAHVRMALRLQAAFGLRREEAIKFRPKYADRGDHIAVKASTAKGGRPRDVPVLKDEQRRVLDESRRLAGGGAMIPPGRNYAEQKRVYMDQTKAAGLDHMHGLRHAYALDRYEDLTGWKAPAVGGPARHTLKAEKVRLDTAARLTIAAELGHSRLEVARQYCG